MNLYVCDRGWKGAAIIVAESYEAAHEIFKKEEDEGCPFLDFKQAFEEYSTKDGLYLATIGDR